MSNKWDPFRDLVTFQEHINRLFEGAITEHRHENGLAGWHPPVDVCETETEIQLFIEIAGISASDFDLQIDGNNLVLRGERKRRQRHRKNYHMSEILMGPFHRSFQLPDTVDKENIQASYEQGILKIVLPKTDKPNSLTVPIKVT